MIQQTRVVLAGDIGGTKTRLAVFEVAGTALKTVAEVVYPSRDYSAFTEIVQEFLSSHAYACDGACFGVAGPVRQGVCETTNLPWRLVAADLSRSLGIAGVALLNDLEASAWGLRTLGAEDLLELAAGEGTCAGNAATIAAGTGLGEAGMYWDGTRHRPFATEGGHADFSPGNDLETALLRYLSKRYTHVSWERVVSGPGLVNIHAFLREYRRDETPSWLVESIQGGDPAAAISEAALDERDEICVEALDLFVHLYGVEAGNLALKMMAAGGVYVGGGIAPKIIDKLQEDGFMQGFVAKGRMQPLLEAMPVRVILNHRTALYGSAVFAASLGR
jgi:glucokinase